MQNIIGVADASKENEIGRRFRETLVKASMSATNTFVSGPGTWFSSYGTEHRLDYFCVPTYLANCVCDVGASLDIDLSTSERIDHRILTAVVKLPVVQKPLSSVSEVLKRQRHTHFNRANLKDPVMCAKFEY